ncbi:MAG: hypothetical protein LLF83_06515 [Methanobacterium sp.]|nr:hypothetical protein [Methanobacterium sp.]
MINNLFYALFLATSISDKIINAFKPIIDLMKGLSYPTCFIMMGAGILLIISGNKHKGTDMIKWAGIGYLLMQLLPSCMTLLSEIGNSII